MQLRHPLGLEGTRPARAGCTARLLLIASAGAWASACVGSDARDVSHIAPDAVAMAVWSLDSNEVLRGELSRRGPDGSAVVIGGPTYAAFYDADTLSSVGLDPETWGSREPLRRPETCEIELPVPDEIVFFGDDGPTSVTAEEVDVRLTTDAIATQCALPAEAIPRAVFAADQCANRCRLEFQSIDACRARVLAEGCDRPLTLVAGSDARGNFCIRPPPESSCEPAPPLGALASVTQCDFENLPCRFAAVRPELLDPFEVIDEISLLDPPRPISRPSTLSEDIVEIQRFRASPERLDWGWAQDFVVREDHILAVRLGRVEGSQLGCTSGAPSELIELARPELAIVRTATLPPCLHRIAEASSTPDPDDFWAIYNTEGSTLSVSVGRLGRSGQVLEQVTIDQADEEDGELWVRPIDIVSFREPRVLLLTSSARIIVRGDAGTGAVRDDVRVTLVDHETLAVVDRRAVGVTSISETTPISERAFLTVDSLGSVVGRTTITGRGRSARLDAVRSIRLGAYEVDEIGPALQASQGGQDIMVAPYLSVPNVTSIYIGTFSGIPIRNNTLPGDWVPTHLFDWTDELFLVTGYIDRVTETPGMLFLLDVESATPLLPVRLELGEGPIRRVRRDADGDLWALFPWTGSLAHIRGP